MSNAQPRPITPDLNPEPAFKGFLNQFTGLTSIMTNEDRTAQYTFVRGFIRDLDPQGPVEIHFARTVALDSWRLNRIKAVEENIFAYGQVLPNKHFTSEIPQVEHAIGHAHTYLRFAESMNRISLYESRLNRSVARNLELLLKLQSRRTPATSKVVAMPALASNCTGDVAPAGLASNCKPAIHPRESEFIPADSALN